MLTYMAWIDFFVCWIKVRATLEALLNIIHKINGVWAFVNICGIMWLHPLWLVPVVLYCEIYFFRGDCGDALIHNWCRKFRDCYVVRKVVHQSSSYTATAPRFVTTENAATWLRRHKHICLVLYCTYHLSLCQETGKQFLHFWCDFDRASSLICGNEKPTRCNRGFLLQILLLAQHVSGTTTPIIRSSRVLYSGCCLW